MNKGATIGPEGVNCAGDILFFFGGGDGSQNTVALMLEPPSPAFA